MKNKALSALAGAFFPVVLAASDAAHAGSVDRAIINCVTHEECRNFGQSGASPEAKARAAEARRRFEELQKQGSGFTPPPEFKTLKPLEPNLLKAPEQKVVVPLSPHSSELEKIKQEAERERIKPQSQGASDTIIDQKLWPKKPFGAPAP